MLRAKQRKLRKAAFRTKFVAESKYVNGVDVIGVCASQKSEEPEFDGMFYTENYDELLEKVDVLLGLLHKKPPRRSSYEAQLSDSDSLVTTTQIAKEYQTLIVQVSSNDDAGRIQVVIESLGFTQEFRAENDILAIELFTNRSSVAHRDCGLNNHDGVRVIFHDQLNYSFNRRRIKVLGLAIIVSALKFVRRSCSTVAYKAHLLPYVATYPLFRA